MRFLSLLVPFSCAPPPRSSVPRLIIIRCDFDYFAIDFLLVSMCHPHQEKTILLISTIIPWVLAHSMCSSSVCSVNRMGKEEEEEQQKEPEINPFVIICWKSSMTQICKAKKPPENVLPGSMIKDFFFPSHVGFPLSWSVPFLGLLSRRAELKDNIGHRRGRRRMASSYRKAKVTTQLISNLWYSNFPRQRTPLGFAAGFPQSSCFSFASLCCHWAPKEP